MNPFTTQNTDPFGLQIFDQNGFILYEADLFTFTMEMSASNFAFSFVSSDSPVNGESSLYSLSLTLSVDTPIGSVCEVTLPPEVSFDETSEFVCRGTYNLAEELACDFNNDRNFKITLTP
jgi:hypothetical protein